MTALVKYEAARVALQAAHDVDEVKDIRDKAQAMAAYAKQAQDNEMVLWASEIKVRAERRAGEMLAEMPKPNGGRPKTGNPRVPVSGKTGNPEVPVSLEELGVSKKQSSQWQKVAAIPEEKFEKAVADTKVDGIVTTAAVLRSATKPKKAAPKSAPTSEKKPSGDAAKISAELREVQGQYADLLEKHTELVDTARELEDKLTMYEATDPDEQQKLIADLQKKAQRKDAEIARLKVQIRDLNNKCNDLIRQVKIEKRKRG